MTNIVNAVLEDFNIP